MKKDENIECAKCCKNCKYWQPLWNRYKQFGRCGFVDNDTLKNWIKLYKNILRGRKVKQILVFKTHKLDFCENYFDKERESDEKLLEAYKWGFDDELNGAFREWEFTPLLLRAYEYGKIDAKIGDDVSSCDMQTEEEILKQIKQKIRNND